MFPGRRAAALSVMCLFFGIDVDIQVQGAEISGKLFELKEQRSLAGTEVTIEAVVDGIVIKQIKSADGTYRLAVPDDKVFDLFYSREGVATRQLVGIISKKGREMVIDVTVPEPQIPPCVALCPTPYPSNYWARYAYRMVNTAAPATIVVTLPADAKLTFGNSATHATSSYRVFSSPPLEVGHGYYYVLTAEILRDGKPITATQRVNVRAGQTTYASISFEKPGTSVRR